MITTFFTSLVLNSVDRLENFKEVYSFIPESIFTNDFSVVRFIICLYFFRLIIVFINANLRCVFPQTLTYLIRRKITINAFSTPLMDIEKIRTGELVGSIALDSAKTSLFIFNFIEFSYVSMIVITYLFILAGINLKILVIGILILTPLLIIIRYVYSKITEFTSEQLKVRDSMISDFTERFHNIRFIKAMGSEDSETGVMLKMFKKYRHLEIRRFLISYLGSAVPQIILFLGVAFLLTAVLYDQGSYKLFVTLYLLPMSVIGARGFNYLNKLNDLMMQMHLNRVYSKKIFQSWQDTPHSTFRHWPKNSTGIVLSDTLNTVEFRNVSFGYNDNTIISNINFTVARGKPIIIKGESGSGKTTIGHLLRLLVKPKEGEIYFNGIKASSLNLDLIKHKIAYATQDPVLLYGSIRDNLLYGNANQISTEKINSVLKKVKADRFVANMQEGLETVINEKGSNLSGGQKQRLALARLLMRDPEILILDEITSGLDNENKMQIIRMINKLSSKIICIAISHDQTFSLKNACELNIEIIP